MDKTMVTVKQLLGTARTSLAPPANTPHNYLDKYLLAEYTVNLGIAATLNALGSTLGVTPDILNELVAAAAGNETVTLKVRGKTDLRSFFLAATERLASLSTH
jgi:hypothetical protein